AVLRYGAPAAVFVEVFIANDVIGDVTRRSGAIPTAIAVAAPMIEVVVIVIILNVGAQFIGSAERAGLIGMDCVRRTAASDFAVPAANFHKCTIARFVHRDAIASRT